VANTLNTGTNADGPGRSVAQIIALAERLASEGDREGAYQALKEVINEEALPAAVLNNAALLLRNLHRLEEADHVFERAILADPTQDAPLVNRGALLRGMGRFQEALQLLLKAVHLNPRSAVGWNNIGMLLRDMKRFPQAIKAFQMAVAAAPQWALPHTNLGTAFSETGEGERALAEFEKAVALEPEDLQWRSNLLMCLNYVREPSPGRTAQALAEYGTRLEFAASSDTVKQWHLDRDPERRLRVGFVSGDFVNHSVAWFLEPLLKQLKGSDLDCIGFSNSPARDAVTDRLRASCADWFELWNVADEPAEQLIRGQCIDVLVDLSGHTAGNRLPLFARKPAPIQMSAIGYLHSSGLTAMDYRITDRWLDPMDAPGVGEGPEQLIRLEHGAFGFRMIEDAPVVGPLPSEEAGLVLGSFNHLPKLQPDTLRLWAEVMHAIPRSRLVILAGDIDGVRAKMTALGVAENRIQGSHRLPLPEFYNLLQGIHFALDTFPFNGLTVTLLAAWMGVPTVTLEGDTPHGRAGKAVAERLGYPELAARTPAQYAQTCLQLARDRERLTQIRATLRDRVKIGFGNDALHAQQFSDAVRSAWRRWLSQD